MPGQSATLWRRLRAEERRWHRWVAWILPIQTPDRLAPIPSSWRTRMRSSASTPRTRSRVFPRTRTRLGQAVGDSYGCLLGKNGSPKNGTVVRAACPGDEPVINLAKNVWPSVPLSKPPGKFLSQILMQKNVAVAAKDRCCYKFKATNFILSKLIIINIINTCKY